MASAQEAVRRLRIEVTANGADKATEQLNANAAAYAANAVAAGGAEKGTSAFETRLASLQRQYDVSNRQQAEYNKLMLQNVSALSATTQAANDNHRAIAESGLQWAEWGNHLRQAGEAALILSPKFRALVLSMRDPALTAARAGIEGAATGIVVATNTVGRGMVELGVKTAQASTALAPFGQSIAMAGASLAAFNPTIASAATNILGRFLPAISLLLRIAGPILLIKDAIGLVFEAWELGGKKLDEYRQIAERAAAVDLSTSYFQRITKGAEAAKVPVEAITKALDNLQRALADKLGGSDLQSRLDASVKVGNFAGNSGVAQFAAANTMEEKYKAIVSLIRQAMDSGQRLAALDIAGKALGPEMVENLRKDHEYLDKINEAAAKVADKQLVSDADVGRAQELQRRYDAAVAILSQRWHPIQDKLTELGIRMQAAWVGIVESVATGFDWAAKLVAKLGEVPEGFWSYLKSGLNVASGVAAALPGPIGAGLSLVTGAASAAISDGTPAASADARDVATNKLAAGLRNLNAVKQAAAEANAVVDRVIKDTSRNPDQKVTEQQADAIDRATNSLRKHIEQQIADAAAMDLGAGAQARLRAEGALAAAVKANDGKITAEQAAEYEKLKVRAEEAADALARARVQSNIKFGRETAFLSAEDVQIAQQLKSIYPDVATALGSVEAQALRTNNAMQQLGSLGQDVNRSFWAEAGQNLRNGVTGWAAWANAGLNALGRIGDKLIQMAADKLWTSAFGGSSGLGGLGGLISGLFGGGGAAASAATGSVGVVGAAGGMVVPTFFHGGGDVGSGGTQRGAFPVSMFHQAPRFHLGTDEVPAILQRGEKVIPKGQNDNSGSRMISVSMPVSVSADGSDGQSVVSAVRSYVNSPEFDAKVISSVTEAKKRRRLS